MNYSKYLKKYDLPWWGWMIVILIFFGILYGLFCLNAWLLMMIWNAVIPEIFSLTTITFNQSRLLILLVWILRSFPLKINNTNA